MKVLIIEDEPQAQLKLKRILNSIDHDVEVLACLDSIVESVNWLGENTAELIFMDIQLADGSAFEIFKKIEISTPVIFTTAYDEYAIQAFKVNSIDYLLKPLDENAVINAVQKFGRLHKSSTSSLNFDYKVLEQLSRQLKTFAYKSRFMIVIGDRIKYIDTNDIAYFKSDGNIVFLISKDAGKFIVSYTLDQLNTSLDPALFFRVNRSYLTNISSIKDVRKHFNSRLKVYIQPAPDDEVFVSRVKVPDFLNWMDSK